MAAGEEGVLFDCWSPSLFSSECDMHSSQTGEVVLNAQMAPQGVVQSHLTASQEERAGVALSHLQPACVSELSLSRREVSFGRSQLQKIG